VQKVGRRHKTFFVLEIWGTQPLEEIISEMIFDLGGLGMEIGERSIRVFFEDPSTRDVAISTLVAFLRDLFGQEAIAYKVWELTDPGWELEWRKYFRPQWVGESLLILAPCHEYKPIPHVQTLIMDPGPAFGTGRHATTKMCLMALRDIRGLYPDPWSVLDVGTGSGILAIYAARLGACDVMALDVDEDALSWAKRNLALNGVGEKVILSCVPVEDLQRGFDTIVANISCDVILELMPQCIKRLKRGGMLILSGILESELGRLLKASPQGSLDLYSVSFQEEWACVCLKRS
jgi:ribosomal protein L11 methyltransferase